MKNIVFALLIVLSTVCHAQTSWYKPEVDGGQLHGQLMQREDRSNYYHRLPDVIKSNVRAAVWNLSHNAAGQSLKFHTNSTKIVIKYVVVEGHSMNHMPATGKSGLDLYATDLNGRIKWCGAKRSFGDTIVYNYSPIAKNKGFEYELDLPPYNTVKSLQIGVDEKASFKFSNPTDELPIIVYGTSITQGACASRPGMIWTSIVRRELKIPLVNLGFSGNGLLEKGILDVIKTTPAKLIILDCLPNMVRYKKSKITALTVNAVQDIRKSQANVPIILADHLGYPHSEMMINEANKAEISNEANLAAYKKLLEMGYSNLHHLTYDDIAMPNDGTVEGVHPSDYGMRAYSDAYIKMIREVLYMPKGEFSTQKAVTQQRDSYNWRERHADVLSSVKKENPKVVVFGNSIMHQWGGVQSVGYPCMRGGDSWDEMTKGKAVINMGAGWDKVENVLWRVYHGALDGYDSERIIVAIGINNMNSKDSENDIVEGIRTLIQAIKLRQPNAELKICGIFPMRSKEHEIEKINKSIKKMAKGEGVLFGNPGLLLLTNGKKVDMSFYQNDGLHLNTKGYCRIVKDFFSE